METTPNWRATFTDGRIEKNTYRGSQCQASWNDLGRDAHQRGQKTLVVQESELR